MSDNNTNKPLTFPITHDPFSGYSYKKGQQHLIDGEHDQNKMDGNHLFQHPLGKKYFDRLNIHRANLFSCHTFISNVNHNF